MSNDELIGTVPTKVAGAGPLANEAVNVSESVFFKEWHFIFGFGALGLLIGNLIGFTKESVVNAFIPLILTFGGGSIIAFLGGVPQVERVRATLAVGCISIFCLLGLYFSLFVTESQLLTPELTRSNDLKGISSIDSRKLLRSDITSRVTQIDQQLRNNQINQREAYDALVEFLSEYLN